MLLGQYLRGRHQTALKAVVGSHEHTEEGDDGFPTPYIPLQQPVHLSASCGIPADLFQHSFLCAGETEGQMILIKMIENRSDFLKDDAP